MVMIAGRPSGIAEATRATTIMNMCSGVSPRQKVPSRKVTVPMVRMAMASMRPKRSICCSSGVVVWSMLPSMRLILPSSVSAPVPTTTPLACP
ncbi:hypothetical protein D3C76_708710 [compost metagenome]